MNTVFCRHVFFLVSLATFAVVGNGLSAQAETINTVGANAPALPAVSQDAAEIQQPQHTSSTQEATQVPAPLPGTTNTSAVALTQEISPSQQPSAVAAPEKVAQAPVSPGRTTQGGSSYIGIGGNIGISGASTALGDGNFAVISKIGLTRTFSVRPGAVIGDDSTVLIPITYDFSFNPGDAFTEPLPITPYLGAGVVIGTGAETDVGPMITVGVDYPITAQFTATAGLNVGFIQDTSVGLQVGVGYNFRGFGF